ncbi:MAG: MBL fold metallo-hydrolase [Syntrophus sp. (in: bacteria)]|nr:MBL fold metallo-hydrolase [Syntrophus sp. (in: bacteria)]
MKVKILGSGTLNPSMERGSPSYLVTVDGLNILVDIGPAVVKRLFEYGISANDIDVIVVTHFHVDHTVDLSTFFFVSNYGVTERTKPLLVVGGQGVHKFYRSLLRVYPWIKPKSYELSLKSMSGGGILQIGGFTMKTARVNHNRESIALRIEADKSITFSGDTGYSKNLVRLSSGTDLLVVDCSFPEKKVKGHLNLATLERVAREAQPKKVMLSHLYPEWDEFRGVLYSPYLLAEDGLEVEL